MALPLCLNCNGAVNLETNEETREIFRDLIGLKMGQDSNLCFVCRHMLNKLSMFRSVCVKRSLRHPLRFSKKKIVNMQRSNTELLAVCPDNCIQNQQQKNLYHVTHNDMNDENENKDNILLKLDDDHRCEDSIDQLQTNNTEETVYVKTEPEDIEDNKDLNDELNDTNENIEGNKDLNDELNDTNENIEDNKDLNNELNDTNENIEDNKDLNDELIIKNENNDTEIDNDIKCNDNNEHEVVSSSATTVNKEIDLNNKNKKSNKTKKIFKKIILSLEEQKMELETKRRVNKFLEAEFKCGTCAMQFLLKDSYRAHMVRHEESNGEYQCATCTLRFVTSIQLRAHTASHTYRYTCTLCGKSLKPRAKRTHSCGKKKEIPKVPCPICGNLFKDRSGLQQHLKRVHLRKTGGRPLSCSACGASYKSNAALRTHMIKHIKRKFACDQCPSVYSSPYTLQQHKRTHTNTERHFCRQCGLSYSTRKSLMSHRRYAINHQQTMFECPICSRMCPHKKSLASHIQTVHSASKEYKCTTCPARYTSRKSLVRHLRTHAGAAADQIAVCHLCGSTFKGTNKLNRHLREVCEKEKHFTLPVSD